MHDLPTTVQFVALLNDISETARIDRDIALTTGTLICNALRRLDDLDCDERRRAGNNPGKFLYLSTFSKVSIERCELILRNLFRCVSARDVETHLSDVMASLVQVGVSYKERVVPMRLFCELLQKCRKKETDRTDTFVN
jgi:hypothetical protein